MTFDTFYVDLSLTLTNEFLFIHLTVFYIIILRYSLF